MCKGILSINIRQAMDLEIGATDELADEELKHPYNPDQVVSPYAILYINDSKVYQTRAKLRNPCPVSILQYNPSYLYNANTPI